MAHPRQPDYHHAQAQIALIDPVPEMPQGEIIYHEGHEEMEFDTLSNQVIGCAIEVHRELGPGLLESTYEQCLAHELALSGRRRDLPFTG